MRKDGNRSPCFNVAARRSREIVGAARLESKYEHDNFGDIVRNRSVRENQARLH